MARAISRGVDSVEELEEVEYKEAEALAAREVAPYALAPSTTPSLLGADFAPLWETVYPEVPLEPSLMVDFGLVGGSSFLVG
jgi:hypothetical protein